MSQIENHYILSRTLGAARAKGGMILENPKPKHEGDDARVVQLNCFLRFGDDTGGAQGVYVGKSIYLQVGMAPT